MKQVFEYSIVSTALESLTLENSGNCCLALHNAFDENYYLVVRTQLGVTRIFEYGPYINGGFPTTVKSSFVQFDYSEYKIYGIISRFIESHDADKVTECKYDEIESHLLNLKELLKW